jgi:endonuclease G, mitochondrial
MNKASIIKKSRNILVVLIFSALLFSCKSPYPYDYIKSEHTVLGVPYDNDITDDYIIQRPEYVLSYNKNKNIPNWVAWDLNKEWFGDTKRYSGDFITDTSLPDGYYRVTAFDYSHSGYDRGHLCPSYERTNDFENNKSTFVLTNIYPQMPDLNQGVWKKFEEYYQKRCLEEYKQMYIVAGGIFSGNNIMNEKVSEPDSCFKIVIMLSEIDDWKNIDDKTEIICVTMPNKKGIRKDDWMNYKTTLSQIQKSSGYKFLYNVPMRIREKLLVK